jgi:hypothetical protein
MRSPQHAHASKQREENEGDYDGGVTRMRFHRTRSHWASTSIALHKICKATVTIAVATHGGIKLVLLLFVSVHAQCSRQPGVAQSLDGVAV